MAPDLDPGDRMVLDPPTAYGALAVTVMMLCYGLERRSPWFVLAFAGACVASSSYGFLQGAWPFGIVELVCSLVGGGVPALAGGQHSHVHRRRVAGR